jgi:hypothetical protein
MSSSTCPKCGEEGWFHPIPSHGVETTHHGLSIHRLHGFHPWSGLDHDRHWLTFARRFPFYRHPVPFPALEAVPPLRTHNYPLTHLEKVSKWHVIIRLGS